MKNNWNDSTEDCPDEGEIRANYRWFLDIQTRWNDNDQYGHVNNSIYHSYMEIAVMRFLVEEHKLDVHSGDFRAFTVENRCRYHYAIKFPQRVTCGMRVDRLGNSSIRYGLGLFVTDREAAAATGYCIDVCVDPRTEKPTPIPERVRQILETIAA